MPLIALPAFITTNELEPLPAVQFISKELLVTDEKETADACVAGGVHPEPMEKSREMSSNPVVARLPVKVVADIVTILIHTFWLILSRAVPKSTVTVLFENVPPPVVIEAGEVAIVVKLDGEAPNP